MLEGNRNLANVNESVMGEIISHGVKAKKEHIIKNIIPRKLAQNHIKRRYWIHDLEFFDTTYNCIGVSVSSLIGNSKMSLSMAIRMLYREIIKLTNEQSGGIGFINFDKDMSSYITDESDDEISEQIRELYNDLNVYVRKGCEKAYITLNFGLDTTQNGRRLSRIMLKEYEAGDSEGNPFIFPNLVFKVKSGVNSEIGDINYDIFEKSCEVTSKCMMPTYFNCDSSLNRLTEPELIGIMGCRTRVVNNLFGKKTSINRGNIACVTINLVQISLESNNDIELFKDKLNEVMEDSKELLIYRFNTLSDKNNFRYLKEKRLYLGSENNDNKEMLRNGTLSIGFIGLWDAIGILLKKKITKNDILKNYQRLAYEIIEFMRGNINKYTAEENLNFSLLASSAEGVSGEFPKYDKENYKNVKGVLKKDYYSNSFHVPVNIDIGCFEKIIAEGAFHKLCNGGAITYIELNEIPFKNIEGIKELILFAQNQDCSYFGINFPLDTCQECGYVGKIEEKCPSCSGKKILKLRRVSGYLADINKFTKGKYAELKERKANKVYI